MDTVVICNLALGMLGMPTITGFDEQNNSAQLCKKFFPVLRDRVLRDHTWSFATTARELSVAAKVGFDPDFPVVCPLPVDVIRVLRLIPEMPFRRHGAEIHTVDVPQKVVYIRRIENPNDFDPTFVEALQYLLAAELGMANTRDAQLINSYRQEYERRLVVARSIDSQENRDAYRPDPPRSRWLAARGASSIPIPRGKANFVKGDAGKQGA